MLLYSVNTIYKSSCSYKTLELGCTAPSGTVGSTCTFLSNKSHLVIRRVHICNWLYTNILMIYWQGVCLVFTQPQRGVSSVHMVLFNFHRGDRRSHLHVYSVFMIHRPFPAVAVWGNNSTLLHSPMVAIPLSAGCVYIYLYLFVTAWRLKAGCEKEPTESGSFPSLAYQGDAAAWGWGGWLGDGADSLCGRFNGWHQSWQGLFEKWQSLGTCYSVTRALIHKKWLGDRRQFERLFGLLVVCSGSVWWLTARHNALKENAY